ncbi:MAG TPA: type II toxin-antitoxin system Phd/YefM family antitoxin [Xanthobacteraceae bacterium]
MPKVSATQFARQFARFQHEARRETVVVVSHDRPVGYFLSPEEFAEFEELRAKARRHLRAGALSEETIRAIRAARMAPEHAHLDALMD